MKSFFVFLTLLFLLVSCSGDAENTDKKVNNVEQEDVVEDISELDPEVSYTDTIHEFYGLPDDDYYYFGNSDSHDTLITIKNKQYRLHVECELDRNQRVLRNAKYPNGDKLYMSSIVGYQAYYTFSLFDGTKQLFKRKLNKEDFKEADYWLVVTSDAYLPNFIQYNPRFDALIFQVPFYIDGSCSVSDALLVMGLEGKVKTVDYLSSPSGHNTSNDIQITPDKRHLITSSYIHNSDGTKRSFIKKGLIHMGTDVFDDCLLVVYEYDAKTQPKNAYLQDYAGKTLLNFKYQGWTGGLGFYFLYRKIKNAYYFIDEDNKYLIKVRKENGKWKSTNLPFSSMQEFDGNQAANEVEVDLTTEVTRFTFYINTENGKIRKVTPEDPNY